MGQGARGENCKIESEKIMTRINDDVLSRLDYVTWWHIVKFRIKTDVACQKIRQAEILRIKGGIKLNGYGDLGEHKIGFVVHGRHYTGVRVTLMNGFHKARRQWFPEKSVGYVTTQLLEVVEKVLPLLKIENEKRIAKKAGLSLSAWRKLDRATAAALA
jgi:hypothetical protein